MKSDVRKCADRRSFRGAKNTARLQKQLARPDLAGGEIEEIHSCSAMFR
jgi:hypothetical protein